MRNKSKSNTYAIMGTTFSDHWVLGWTNRGDADEVHLLPQESQMRLTEFGVDDERQNAWDSDL